MDAALGKGAQERSEHFAPVCGRLALEGLGHFLNIQTPRTAIQSLFTVARASSFTSVKPCWQRSELAGVRAQAGHSCTFPWTRQRALSTATGEGANLSLSPGDSVSREALAAAGQVRGRQGPGGGEKPPGSGQGRARWGRGDSRPSQMMSSRSFTRNGRASSVPGSGGPA